jgi:hypothetical protein
MVRSAGVWLAVAPILLSLGGCGEDAPENVGRVSGKVTLDGQPLPGALVTFSPVKSGGAAALGKSDGEGQYSLYYTSGIEGAEIGENRVSVSTFNEGDPDDDPPRAKVLEKVPLKYNARTELVREVKAGDNTIDLDLKSDGPIIPDPNLVRDQSSCGCGGE